MKGKGNPRFINRQLNKMADQDDENFNIYECPVCLEYFEKPIRQCVKGHSFCEKCLRQLHVKICPECRSDVTETRNYKLEELLEKASLPCIYKKAGCPFVLNITEMSKHVLECKHRILECEGKKWCKWECNWKGHDILKHFQEAHPNSKMEYTSDLTQVFDTKDKHELHLISAHYQLFWFKQKVDTKNEKIYWAFQFIGPKKNASYYYYEFEIYNKDEPIKKYKITEYCVSDVEDLNDIFSNEKCASISFKMLRNYLNPSNMFSFRFRLMKIPNPDKQKVKYQKEGPKIKNPEIPPLIRTPNPLSQVPMRNDPIPPLMQKPVPLSQVQLQNHQMQPFRFDLNGPVWLPVPKGRVQQDKYIPKNKRKNKK